MKYGDKVKDLLEEIDAVSEKSAAGTEILISASTPEVPKEAYE